MFLFNPIRKLVSGDKTRHVDEKGEFDLDLTYITDRVLAMAFPGDGFIGTFRNASKDVAEFLDKFHGPDHYRIYNLSELFYDYEKFHGNVVEYGFPDHHCPPLDYLFEICRSIHDYLNQDKRNIVIVHCLAGRGRTGTVIACYLTFNGMFDNGSEALDYFAKKRSSILRGVQQPSQRRYVQYFSEIHNGRQPKKGKLLLKQLIMYSIPIFDKSYQGCCPVLEIFTAPSQKCAKKLLFSSLYRFVEDATEDNTTTRNVVMDLTNIRQFSDKKSENWITFDVNLVLEGDVYIRMYHLKQMPVLKDERIIPLDQVPVIEKKKTSTTRFMFRVSFHTGFVPSASVLRLTKNEIDDAIKSKKFEKDFFVDFLWEKIPSL